MRELRFMDFPELHRASTDAYLKESISAGNTPITDEEWVEWYERKFNIKLEIRRPDLGPKRFKTEKHYYVTDEQYTLLCLRWK